MRCVVKYVHLHFSRLYFKKKCCRYKSCNYSLSPIQTSTASTYVDLQFYARYVRYRICTYLFSNKSITMKLALLSVLAATASAFAPAPVAKSNTQLHESKVCMARCSDPRRDFGCLIAIGGHTETMKKLMPRTRFGSQ